MSAYRGGDPAVVAALSAVGAEVARASALHPTPLRGRHEALGVIREEYVELEAEVFKRRPSPTHLRAELVQLAAMCVRALADLGLAHGVEEEVA